MSKRAVIYCSTGSLLRVKEGCGAKAIRGTLPSTVECIVILFRVQVGKGGRVYYIKICLNIFRKRKKWEK